MKHLEKAPLSTGITSGLALLIALMGALAPIAVPAPAAAVDPSQNTIYPACGPITFIWNGNRGRIFHPKNGTCESPVYSPLVALFHGATYDYRDYDYLLRHLAKNGFIAVSLAGNGTLDHIGVAGARQYMDGFLWTVWAKRFYIDPHNVALIGHSRGAETARRLAQDIAADASAPWTVRAVVTLAGVSSGAPYLDEGATGAYLLLHGTNDLDQGVNISFAEYDRAGTEESNIGLTFPFYKTLKILEKADHSAFSTKLGSGGEQQALTKGYTMAFLRAHLHDDFTWYDDYVRGDAVPNGWTPGVVVSQHSDGLVRRVIDNFEDGTVGPNTMGGAVVKDGVTATVVDLAPDLDPLGATQALSMVASDSQAHITWRIPAAERDWVGYRWLSFRIGLEDGGAVNDLKVQIRNGLVWSDELRVTDFGTIPPPVHACIFDSAWTCDAEPALMGTVLIPLSELGTHDDVDRVRFRFRGDSVNRDFLFDSLELAGLAYWP